MNLNQPSRQCYIMQNLIMQSYAQAGELDSQNDRLRIGRSSRQISWLAAEYRRAAAKHRRVPAAHKAKVCDGARRFGVGQR